MAVSCLLLGCLGLVAAPCGPESEERSPRTQALEDSAWSGSEWISVADAPVYEGAVANGGRAADGTSWFVQSFPNGGEVVSAKWMTAGLGVYELYVNGRRVGTDFLRPGFTHNEKTKYSFTYDVTALVDASAAGTNQFAAEVSAGWWRDKICTPPRNAGGYFGRKSAFRGVVELTLKDGTKRRYGTTRDWKAGIAGPVTHAAIYDGEEYDARLTPGFRCPGRFGRAEANEEFKGAIFPTCGAEVCLRWDLAMRLVEAYVWKGVDGASGDAFGKIVKTRSFGADGKMTLGAGETLVVDFGQNAAAVPCFRFSAKNGTVLTALPAEMLNDGNGEKCRGNDGPAGSAYRVNLREGHENGRLVRYTFSGDGVESYLPRFTYFGYRYVSITATDEVTIESVRSVPVSSIRAEDETGRLEVGDASLQKFIDNVLWTQRSNFLSVPTDCPQRNERLGWGADAQMFSEAASFNADVYGFFRKWMRDMRDSQYPNGGFPAVAPLAQYGRKSMRIGWADAGVIVPYSMWKQFGDLAIVRDNWEAMTRFLNHVEETEYAMSNIREDCCNGQYADWLSFEDYEPCNGNGYEIGPDGVRRPNPDAVVYWDFLGGCYWLSDARMMAEMARAVGKPGEAERWTASAARAKRYLQKRFVDPDDGMLVGRFRHLQGAAVFALHCGMLDRPEAIAATKAAYRKNLAEHDGCNMTGILGTSVLMDTLVDNGMTDVAYDLLFNHKFPSWLYSVDQGATTVWERWNSYTKEKGFGPVTMNSFNHYAYGSVVAWIYKTAAGIAADPRCPGFKNVVMAPTPDRRLGYVRAEYRSPVGTIKSAWRFEGDDWIWEFTIPEGATADVMVPGEDRFTRYSSGRHLVKQSNNRTFRPLPPEGSQDAKRPYEMVWAKRRSRCRRSILTNDYLPIATATGL